MKKWMSVCAVALATSTSAATAQEPVQGYVVANYLFATYEEDGISEEFDLGAVIAKAGAQLNPYVAAELRGGVGVTDDSATFFDVEAELELDYLAGAYLLAGIPNETPFYPYVVAGFTKGELTFSATGPGGSVSFSESESDFSYGVGTYLAISEQVHLNAEYMNYLDKDDVEITGVSIGAKFLF